MCDDVDQYPKWGQEGYGCLNDSDCDRGNSCASYFYSGRSQEMTKICIPSYECN